MVLGSQTVYVLYISPKELKSVFTPQDDKITSHLEIIIFLSAPSLSDVVFGLSSKVCLQIGEYIITMQDHDCKGHL